MLEHERRNAETTVYTYYPFADNSCGENVDVVKLNKCIDNTTISKYFQNKVVYKNRDKSKSCKIRIIANENVPIVIAPDNEAFEVENETMLGIEQYILDIISKDQNFDLEYTYVPRDLGYGNVLDNGTSTGLLKYLANKEADLAICGLILTIERGTSYDYIHGHSYTGFYFVVAAAKEYDWAVVYKEFHLITWILIAIFFFIFCIIIITVKILFQSGTQDNIGTVVQLWGYFFANTSQHLSSNTYLREILACWIWFTFLFSNFYTTAFSSLMIKVPATSIHTGIPPIEVYKPCLPSNSRTFFKTTYNVDFPENTDERCENLDTFVDVCASNSEFYCLVLKPRYISDKWKYFDDKGNYKLEAWEYSGLTTTQGMFVQKGYVFKETLQRRSNMLLEAGLIQYQENMLKIKVNKAVEAKMKTAKGLDLSAIRVAFYVLVFGDSLAVICFLGELVRYHKCKSIQNKHRYVSDNGDPYKT
ncbi:ligated ion channel l-glutamate- and glycine-binding site domain-containing protein [Phthorimaea operculella]|nr:ligated ion channel l-glutamate- and glycine-binding site domain-containing protein [Phthorimaea operculella]